MVLVLNPEPPNLTRVPGTVILQHGTTFKRAQEIAARAPDPNAACAPYPAAHAKPPIARCLGHAGASCELHNLQAMATGKRG